VAAVTYTDEPELTEEQRLTACRLLNYHPRTVRDMWIRADDRAVYAGSDFVGYHRQGYLLIDRMGEDARGIAVDQHGDTRRVRRYG
jgi:hypothetical protein